MPLTEKGKKIMRAMKAQYGSKEGEKVFYASKNKGTIKGVEDETQMNWQNKLYESLTEGRARYGGMVGYSGGGGKNKPGVIMSIETDKDGNKFVIKKDKEGNVVSRKPAKPLPGQK